ncbi:MAG: hypothetical protein AAGF24_10890 [Cyanobacteria bacterium P01_H01_bin.121]
MNNQPKSDLIEGIGVILALILGISFIVALAKAAVALAIVAIGLTTILALFTNLPKLIFKWQALSLVNKFIDKNL